MDTTNSNEATGTDPDEGYVDQDSEQTPNPREHGVPEGHSASEKDVDLEAAKEHEGREEENIGAELLDSMTGANDIDADNGRSAEEAIDDPESMRSGLSGKPDGGEQEGSTAP